MDEQDRKFIDHPLLREVIFYPRRIPEHEIPNLPEGRVIRVPCGRDTLAGYLYKPHPEGKTILFFHGNGEVMTDYFFGFHQAVAELGLNLLVADYRGYGLSTGEPSLSGLLEEAQAWFQAAVKEAGEPGRDSPSQLIIMGRSLGSLPALEAASHAGDSIAGLVIESGIARFDAWIDRMAPLLERLGLPAAPLKSALARHFNHREKLARVKVPVLIMHAAGDEIVPVEHGRELASFADPARTALHIFPRGGHNDIQFLNRDQYFEALGRFVKGL